MKYTACGNRVIEEKIQQEINSIKDKILEERVRWKITSLILYGGFSRGEGSVEVRDGDIMPLNDYDFIAVTSNPLPPYSGFRRFGHILNSYFGRNIDIVIRPRWFMKRCHPSIYYYEIKKSGKVLWGEDIISLMPDIEMDRIPIEDGICTLFNRLMSLLEAYGVEDRRLVVYQCNKAILTCVEILLLIVKEYHWSYKERLSIFRSIFRERFPDLASDLPDFLSMAEQATRFKLSPDYGLYREEELWEKVACVYFRILNEVVGSSLFDIFKSPFRSIFSWLIFNLRKKNFPWHFNLIYQPYVLVYAAGYEWLKAWVERDYPYILRDYLNCLGHIEYTDDFLILKDKIIYNWKMSSVIL